MSEMGESAAVLTIADVKDEDMHFSGLALVYPNGKPYCYNRVDIKVEIDGNDYGGVLNFEAACINHSLLPGTQVAYTLGADVDSALKAVRADIKKELDSIIENEREEEARLDAQFEKESSVNKGLILTGAFMTGVGEGALGLFNFVVDTAEVAAKTVWLKTQTEINVLETAWEKYVEGDPKGFYESLNEKNVEDFANAFGLTPKELANKTAEAYEMLAFIMEDDETQALIKQFAADYVSAQAAVEYAGATGTAAFDLILAIALAATTAGAGNVAHFAAKVRHARRLNVLSRHFKKLVKLLRKKRLNQTVDGKLDEIAKLEINEPKSQPLKAAKVKDDDFKKKSDQDKKAPEDKDQQNQHSSQNSGGANQSDQGGVNNNGDSTPNDSKVNTGGEPISLVTGEEILGLVDFEIDGPLPMAWLRKYKSSNPHNIGLGHGWTHPFAEQLVVTPDKIALHNAEARIITFPTVEVGRSCRNRVEKLTLTRHSYAQYGLTLTGSNREYLYEAIDSPFQLRLTQIRDSLGNQLTLHYQQQKLTRIQASHGDSWVLYYNPQDTLDAIHRHGAEGQSTCLVQYRYDAQQDMVQATDAAGHSEHYAYQHHLITQRTLKSGYRFYFQWSESSPKARCLRNWGDPIAGKPTYDYTFQWQPEEKRVAITDTRGGTEHYQFNELGLPLYHKDQEGGETHSRYDALGNLIEVVDPEGHRERFQYDARQNIRQHTDKQGITQTFVWDNHGNLSQLIDPQGQVWSRQYNQHNQLVRQSNPLGEQYLYDYNALGLVSRVTNPEGHAWHYIWDNRAQLTAIRNPKGQHTRYRYNREGQVSQITWPDKQISQYHYDGNGQCTAIKGPDGNTEQYQYNPLGLLSCYTDSSGRRTQYHYNGLSQVVKRIDPAGQVLHYHYDGERNLIGLTNEKHEHYRLKYDLNERLVEEIGFDGRVQRYAYNKNGHLIGSADYSEDGQTLLQQLLYQRDPQGRLLQQRDGRTQQTLNLFTYDPLGRLQRAQNHHRTLQWKYDPVGRVIEDHQDQQVLQHRYNKAGQRTTTRLPNGDLLHTQFDETGAFSQLNYNEQLVAAISRDTLGRETQRQLGNQLTTQHSYDPQGRLQRQITAKQGAKHGIADRQYHYNAHGQLSQIDDARRGRTEYFYDTLDRLTQVKGPAPQTFLHDPAGNILASNDGEAPAAAEAPQQVQGNRLAFHGDSHYQYDSRGNRIAQARGKGQRLRTDYRYNSLNQLTDVAHNGLHTQYTYDPLGRRITKLSQKSRTDFLWLEDVLLSEVTQTRENDSAPIQKQSKLYLFEPNSFKPLAFLQDKQLYHYHLDHLGTPQEISNHQGEIVWAVSYKAYGNLALAYQQQVENNLRFQGQYFDSESGLHYNRFRYYDPEAGRFVNQDPIGLLGGVNNYLYVPSPISWVDPFGLNSVVTGAGRDHVTYQGIKNGKPYTGYASAPSSDGLSSSEIISRRYGGNFDEFGGQAPETVYSGSGVKGKHTARGLEQHYYEQDVAKYGKENVANGQNPVGPNNGNRENYQDAAKKELDKKTNPAIGTKNTKGDC